MRWWGCPPGSAYFTEFHSLWQANFQIFVDFSGRVPAISRNLLICNTLRINEDAPLGTGRDVRKLESSPK